MSGSDEAGPSQQSAQDVESFDLLEDLHLQEDVLTTEARIQGMSHSSKGTNDPSTGNASPVDTTDPFSLEPQRSKNLSELEKIYWNEINPIFPVLDKESYLALPESSDGKTLMTLAISLGASMSQNATPYLCLSPATDLRLSRKAFSERVSKALLTLINLGVVKVPIFTN